MMSDNVDKNYHNGDNKKMGVRMCTRAKVLSVLHKVGKFF